MKFTQEEGAEKVTALHKQPKGNFSSLGPQDSVLPAQVPTTISITPTLLGALAH